MLNNKLKYLFSLSALLVLAGCSSDSRYHEIQSARMGECSHMADKEYHQWVKQQQDSYKEFKEQQAREQQ